MCCEKIPTLILDTKKGKFWKQLITTFMYKNKYKNLLLLKSVSNFTHKKSQKMISQIFTNITLQK